MISVCWEPENSPILAFCSSFGWPSYNKIDTRLDQQEKKNQFNNTCVWENARYAAQITEMIKRVTFLYFLNRETKFLRN